jgi:hypothetical protein
MFSVLIVDNHTRVFGDLLDLYVYIQICGEGVSSAGHAAGCLEVSWPRHAELAAIGVRPLLVRDPAK